MAEFEAKASGAAATTGVEFTFRSWLWLFVGMVMAELGVLLPSLAPAQEIDFTKLGVLSLYAQWINILGLASLCLLEPLLMRLPRRLMWLCAWLLIVLTSAVLALLVESIDHALLWGLTDYRWPEHRLVFRSALMTALIAGVVLRYLAMHRQWQEGLQVQAQARFQALQARIQPHFLFNSLNSIAALTVEQPEQAEQAVENLSDLMRGALRDPEQAISLGEELELCRSYLAIEALRFGARLQLEWALEEIPLQLMVPPLMLQPLVENAIIHGVQRCRQGGCITIRGYQRDNEVVLEVINPTPASSATQASVHESGIALANLRGRLKIRYAGAASLRTHEEPASADNNGRYCAQITLPLSARM